MRSRASRTATVAAIFVGLSVLLAPASAHHNPNLTAMEEYLVALINEGREDPDQNPVGETFGLAFHEGLRGKARDHAQYMISVGFLNHHNLGTRVATADPDPPETPNTPPDNGFDTSVYCENVARTGPLPAGAIGDGLIVRRVYEAWRDSDAGQRACQFDESGTGYTVAGAGFAEENFTTPEGPRYRMWVSLMVVKDSTPPDRVLYPEPTPTPTPTATVVPTPTATPTTAPSPGPTGTPGPTLPPRPTPTATPGGFVGCLEIHLIDEQFCIYLPDLPVGPSPMATNLA